MTGVSVADGPSARAVIHATVDEPGLVYIRLGRGREPVVYDIAPPVVRGRFITVRHGSDATIIATGDRRTRGSGGCRGACG